MSYKNFLSIYFLSSILTSQEEIPFDVSKHFSVVLDNNQLIWNSDQSFEKLLIDRSSKNNLRIKKIIVSHLKISVPTYKKNKIPNELKLIPISTPGSRYTK